MPSKRKENNGGRKRQKPRKGEEAKLGRSQASSRLTFSLSSSAKPRHESTDLGYVHTIPEPEVIPD